jgi:hypothetical protein
MNEGTNATEVPDPITQRLEEQITWYDCRSLRNQKSYKRIKVVEIVSAAVIPMVSAMHVTYAATITGSLGVLITVLEGLLHLNQNQQNWTTFRSTCEALKHEKYIYLAKAPPYAGSDDAHALLAERIESLVSQENARWAASQQQEAKR